jgi:hypothetical protein
VASLTVPNGEASLAAWILTPGDGEAYETVVFCHGNSGNMEDHVEFVDFLPRHGYRVVMFDYQGYGESSPNEPSRESTASDVSAAIDYSTARWGKPWLMGHSLGAALAIDAGGRRPSDVRGVIAVAPFTSYRAMARKVLRDSPWTRALALPSAVVVLPGHDPVDHVADIAPTPLLLVHGDQDQLIPMRMSQELFDRAREPKELFVVPGAGHNSTWREMGPGYVGRVVKFIQGPPRPAPVPPSRDPLSKRTSSSLSP